MSATAPRTAAERALAALGLAPGPSPSAPAGARAGGDAAADAGAIAGADPLVPAFCRVRGVIHELHDTFTFDLEPPDGRLAFAPGQFNMLALPACGEVPISISGDPAEPERLVHTIRAVGGVTRALERLGPGALVGVRGPYGTAWPVTGRAASHAGSAGSVPSAGSAGDPSSASDAGPPGAAGSAGDGTGVSAPAAAAPPDLIIVAGGLGLAPLRPAVYHVLRHRADWSAVTLLVGARSPKDLLYAQQLRGWGARGDIEVGVTVDAAEPGWSGRVGFVTALLGDAVRRPAATTALLCGPEPMMRFAARDLVARGVAAERIHVSLERNMQCAVGHCGHCQLGPLLLCRDGAVVPWSVAEPLVSVREL